LKTPLRVRETGGGIARFNLSQERSRDAISSVFDCLSPYYFEVEAIEQSQESGALYEDLASSYKKKRGGSQVRSR